MAIFRHPKASLTITQDAIEDIVRITTTKLLDSRLDSRLSPTSSSVLVSSLDSATKDQLVRGVNKLAIQTVIGSSRMKSLLALMSLQVELCDKVYVLDSVDSYETTCRLSRVYAKLFARVIKAEESNRYLLNGDDFDLNTLLQCLAHMLSASDAFTASHELNVTAKRDNTNVSCTNMGKSLVLFLLKSKISPSDIQIELDRLSIHRSSPINKLLDSSMPNKKLDKLNTGSDLTTKTSSSVSDLRSRLRQLEHSSASLKLPNTTSEQTYLTSSTTELNKEDISEIAKKSSISPDETFRSSSSCLRARLNALKRSKSGLN